MVDILVGPEKTLYRVHKDRLCARVPYFAAVMKVFPTPSEEVLDAEPQPTLPALSFPDKKMAVLTPRYIKSLNFLEL